MAGGSRFVAIGEQGLNSFAVAVSLGDDGTLVKTTTRDRAVNPTFDAEPRPATSAEMSALLRPKGALPPATGTPSSAATPTPDVDNPP